MPRKRAKAAVQRRRGRPRSPLDAQLYIRASTAQVAAWERRAATCGFEQSLSAWIRYACDKEAARHDP